jgi:hypothetical protein
MLTTFVFIIFVSYFTKYIFEKGWLQKKIDIFKCVVNIPECTNVLFPDMIPKLDSTMTDSKSCINGFIGRHFTQRLWSKSFVGMSVNFVSVIRFGRLFVYCTTDHTLSSDLSIYFKCLCMLIRFEIFGVMFFHRYIIYASAFRNVHNTFENINFFL